MSTADAPESAALIDEEKADHKGGDKAPETAEAKKQQISQFEMILACFNLMFWGTVFFFGMYELRCEWYGNPNSESFQFIHEMSKGFILMGLALLGSAVTLRELFLDVHKHMTAVGMEIGHTIVMLPAGGIVVWGPWADPAGRNHNMLCTTLGHLAFFASFVLSFFNIIISFSRSVLRG